MQKANDRNCFIVLGEKRKKTVVGLPSIWTSAIESLFLILIGCGVEVALTTTQVLQKFN